MTQEEHSAALAEFTEVETELSATRQAVQDGIDAARKLNDGVRAGQVKLRQLGMKREQLMTVLVEHHEMQSLEAKRIANEKAEAEAKRVAAEEAARPKAPTIADLNAKIEALTEALAAKG